MYSYFTEKTIIMNIISLHEDPKVVCARVWLFSFGETRIRTWSSQVPMQMPTDSVNTRSQTDRAIEDQIKNIISMARLEL